MRSKSVTILLAENDPNDQHLLLMAWQQAGITQPVQVLTGGEATIRYLKGEGEYSDRAQFPYPSFLFLDLKMPCGDGFSVLEHLRRHAEFAIIPTVVFSGSADPDDVRRAYLLGAHAYLRKPLQFSALTRQLKLVHDFWTECEVPEVDSSGRILPTCGAGKLGARFGLSGGSSGRAIGQS